MPVDQDIAVSIARFLRLARLDHGSELHLHAGVEGAPETPVDGGEAYVPGSWLPREDSRPLDPDELAALSRPLNDPHRFPIGIVRVPARTIRRIADNAQAIWGDDGSYWSVPPGRDLLEEILVEAGLTSNGEVRGLGPNRRPPGLRSTTFDSAHGYRIGLHIDSWDAKRITERVSARNRFCLNLGSAAHYLYIVPLSASEVLARIGRTDARAMTPDEVVRQFCAENRDALVLRLGMPPGYGYVAPTDAVIHDGGAAPSTGSDIVITWLGQFGFGGDVSAGVLGREAGRSLP
jgi:hypothetical protein